MTYHHIAWYGILRVSVLSVKGVGLNLNTRKLWRLAKVPHDDELRIPVEFWPDPFQNCEIQSINSLGDSSSNMYWDANKRIQRSKPLIRPLPASPQSGNLNRAVSDMLISSIQLKSGVTLKQEKYNISSSN
jgi:hypothetical protein